MYSNEEVVIEEETDSGRYGCIIAHDGLYYTDEMQIIGVDEI
jgi:hypothetical protein